MSLIQKQTQVTYTRTRSTQKHPWAGKLTQSTPTKEKKQTQPCEILPRHWSPPPPPPRRAPEKPSESWRSSLLLLWTSRCVAVDEDAMSLGKLQVHQPRPNPALLQLETCRPQANASSSACSRRQDKETNMKYIRELTGTSMHA